MHVVLNFSSFFTRCLISNIFPFFRGGQRRCWLPNRLETLWEGN